MLFLIGFLPIFSSPSTLSLMCYSIACLSRTIWTIVRNQTFASHFRKSSNWIDFTSHFQAHFLLKYPSIMSDVLKAEELLPDSIFWDGERDVLAFKKPTADTPGKRDDLDYDIGNLEATDNHQVNMEVGWVLLFISSPRRSLVRTRRRTCSASLVITLSSLSTIFSNFLQKIPTLVQW